MKSVLFLFIFLFLMSAVYCEVGDIPFGVPERDTLYNHTGTSDYFAIKTFGTLLVSLFIIIIVIYLTLLLFKKLSNYGKFSTKIDKNAKILDIFPLNTKQSIYLVRLCDIIYLLGISGDKIELIDKISDPDKIDRLLENSTKNEEYKFKNLLDKFRK